MNNHEVLALWLWNEYQDFLYNGLLPDAIYYFCLYQEVILSDAVD